MTGLVSTLVIVTYGFIAGSAEDLFWSLFAFSSIIFLLPYLVLFSAFVRLRIIDGATPRPYKLPGGTTTACVVAGICTVFILQAIVFFVWVPGEPIDWKKTGPILIGVLLMIIIGEAVIASTQRKPDTLSQDN